MIKWNASLAAQSVLHAMASDHSLQHIMRYLTFFNTEGSAIGTSGESVFVYAGAPVSFKNIETLLIVRQAFGIS